MHDGGEMTKTGRDSTDTGSVKRYQKVLSKGIIKRYQNDLHTQTLYLQLMMSNDRPLCVCVCIIFRVCILCLLGGGPVGIVGPLKV